MRTLTEKEKEALVQFRQNLSDLNLDAEKNSDDYLVRWIRARDGNLQKAEQMLRTSLKWREENNMDEILNWEPPEIYHKIFPMEICGFTPDGIPVVVIPSRYFDPDFFWEMDLDEYTRYSLHALEKLVMENRKHSPTGLSSYEFIGIYDLADLHMRSIMSRRYMSYVQKTTKVFDENYPELIRKAFFVYPPSFFSVLYSMTKPFIPKRTQKKFQFCGSDPEKIKEYLNELIPPDVYPPRFGGLNEEFEKIAFKNCGKRSIIRRESANGEIEIDGFIETSVAAGEKMNFDFDIDEGNTVLKWCFKTNDYDIGFSVNYTKEDDDNNQQVEVIQEYKRPESHVNKQYGSITCQKIGKYTLLFDNTYSRLRSKILHLKVDILKPSDAGKEAA